MFLSIGIATPILNPQVQADLSIGNPVTASITGIAIAQVWLPCNIEVIFGLVTRH